MTYVPNPFAIEVKAVSRPSLPKKRSRFTKKKKAKEKLEAKPALCKAFSELPEELQPFSTEKDRKLWFKPVDKKATCKECTAHPIEGTVQCAYHTAYQKLYGRRRRGNLPQPTYCKGCGVTFTPTNGHQLYCHKDCQAQASKEVHMYKDKLALGQEGYMERLEIIREHGFKCACCKQGPFGEKTKESVKFPRLREVTGPLAKKWGASLAPFCQGCSGRLTTLLKMQEELGWDLVVELAAHGLPLREG